MIDGTLTDLAAAVRARPLSPVEIVTAYQARIERLDKRLRAFITLDAEGALAAPRALKADAVAGRWRGPLHGVPLGFRDLCAVPGLPSSGGSRTRDYFQSPHPCTAVLLPSRCERRPPAMPVGGLLVGVAHAQHRRVLEAPPDDLQAQRKS